MDYITTVALGRRVVSLDRLALSRALVTVPLFRRPEEAMKILLRIHLAGFFVPASSMKEDDTPIPEMCTKELGYGIAKGSWMCPSNVFTISMLWYICN
jgi:hypothetical protein